MQFLAPFLMGFFNAIIVWLSNRVTKTIGITLFVLTVLGSLSLAFYLMLKALVSPLAYAITNQYILMGMSIIWPSNAEICISACITADLAAYIFRYKKAVFWASLPK